MKSLAPRSLTPTTAGVNRFAGDVANVCARDMSTRLSEKAQFEGTPPCEAALTIIGRFGTSATPATTYLPSRSLSQTEPGGGA